MMKKVLFTGVSGLLGRYFILSQKPSYKIIGLVKKNPPPIHISFCNIDVTNKKKVADCIYQNKPDVVIHAASIGNVDYCEKHPQEAYEVNVQGSENVLEACNEIGSQFIFTSSNAIYNGENAPYTELSKMAPPDVYGRTKVEVEKLIKKKSDNYVIVRLMTMYGWNPPHARTNPVTWVISQLQQKKNISVVNDIYNNHLWVGQAASVLWKIIQQGITNQIYNIAGSECVSRYELALKTAEVFDLDRSLISSVPSSFFEDIVPRPKNTCFDTAKMERDFHIKPLSILQGLRKMKKEKNDD